MVAAYPVGNSGLTRDENQPEADINQNRQPAGFSASFYMEN